MNYDKITFDDIQIIVMTHNRAYLLGESIESILNQTSGVKEIIVLDNESSDNTEDIVSHYSSRGVKYLKTYGFLGNFNKAKEISNNKYVMLFHDDDILHPEYLEKVLQILNKEKNIAAVYSRYTEFNGLESPKNFSSLKNNIRNGGGYYLFHNQKSFAKFMFFIHIIAYATAVYKTNLFKEIDIEYQKFSKFNDWPFMCKFAKFGKVALLADKSAFYVRRHNGQDTCTNTNIPSFEQILNWDKFFFDVLFEKKDCLLNKLYSRIATVSYIAKYKAFIPLENRKDFSEKKLREMAKSIGLPDNDDKLISEKAAGAYWYFYENRNLKNFNKSISINFKMIKGFLGFIYRYFLCDILHKNNKEK